MTQEFRPGQARQQPADKLASFGQVNSDDFPAPPGMPAVKRSPVPPPAERVTPAPAAVPVTPARRGRGRPKKSAQAQVDVKIPSNVQIPSQLGDRVGQLCARQNLTHGDLIIVALETAEPHLEELLAPKAKVGGGRFSPRASAPRRRNVGSLSPFHFSFRKEDFDALDGMVEEFGASSRGHLVTVALQYYLDQQPSAPVPDAKE